MGVFSQSFLPETSIADSLLQELANLQIKEQSFYDTGQFPSQRGKHRYEDNNIFFSSLIARSLQQTFKDTKDPLKKSADIICEKIKKNYIHYQHTASATYNFWKTNPAKFFPNSNILSHWSSFHVPDDADCTSIIYLTDTTLRKNSGWLKEKLALHANLSKSKIKNTFQRYRNYTAYSTWFGIKMPIEFDMCVHCNILLYVYEQHLPLNNYDEACLGLLQEQILSGDYKKYAYYLSPSYKKFPIILYHLARLLENSSIPVLKDCREIIKKDIEEELGKATDFMDKVILSTALIRMKGNPPVLMISPAINASMDQYVFFRANLFSSYARPALKFISKTNLFDLNFYCKAYCLTLLLEYESLKGTQKNE